MRRRILLLVYLVLLFLHGYASAVPFSSVHLPATSPCSDLALARQDDYEKYDSMSVADLMKANGVSPPLYRDFLEPLLLAMLFAPPERSRFPPEPFLSS